MDKIGEGKVRSQSGDVLFLIDFCCVTFKVMTGEILEGVTQKIMKHGVFLRCGPVETIFLSAQKKPGYIYIPGENPMFISEKQSKIEKDVTVRFFVVGTRWIETERQFRASASLEGDYVGPVGNDMLTNGM